MNKPFKQISVALTVAIVAFGIGSIQAHAADATKRPNRVLIVVFDQMRPEYSERYDMQNVLRLEKEGAHFKNGYLGHMASETVVSHNVMVSGVFPKHMGWTDEIFRDTKNLLGKGTGAIWESGSLNLDQFSTLIRHAAYPKLVDYLHVARPGAKFIVVGEKDYAVDSIAAPNADVAVRMSDRMKDVTKETGCANLQGAWRYPFGLNVPVYLSQPKCGRYYVNSDKNNDYHTKSQSPSWLYPLDGNKMVPGNDADHLGGDTWVADAAMTMMEKENWSGMLVTLGGIDKAGHMWGAQHDTGGSPGSPDEKTHLSYAVKLADMELGRLLQKLKDLSQLDETLIVITSDHGATYAKNFYGTDDAVSGEHSSYTNWYYGKTVNSEDYNKPPAALKPLIDTGNVQSSYQSTAIETWLKDNSPEKKREAAKVMRSLPGVAATYWRDGDHYVLDAAPGQGTAATLSATELAWWKKHGQELVDTMAADNGPDILGYLADETGYGAKGDHGSAKQSDQRVPMIVWASNLRAEQPAYAFRTVDILPTVLKAMGIRQDKPTDGKAYPVKFR